MQSICVFCGSSKGNNPAFERAARDLGKILAEQKITLVYGGGKIGLMGILADSCLEAGGKVIGVIPKFLSAREIVHKGVTELVMVESMHQRKLKMSQLAEGFIALPGGYGTLEELMEILTWVQLGLISRPVGILNVSGFYNHLSDQFKTMVQAGLVKASNLDFFIFSDNNHDLVKKMSEKSLQMVKLKEKFTGS